MVYKKYEIFKKKKIIYILNDLKTQWCEDDMFKNCVKKKRKYITRVSCDISKSMGYLKLNKKILFYLKIQKKNDGKKTYYYYRH